MIYWIAVKKSLSFLERDKAGFLPGATRDQVFLVLAHTKRAPVLKLVQPGDTGS